MKINTPDEYELFRSGQYELDDIDEVKIYKDAGAELVDLRTEYGNYSIYDEVIIEYDNGDEVYIYPERREISMGFYRKRDKVAMLPADYREYCIDVKKFYKLQDSDIDAILSWEHAQIIKISDIFDITTALAQRFHEMKATHLQELHLTVQRATYKQLSVRPFLESEHPVENVIFKRANDLSLDKFNEFTVLQKYDQTRYDADRSKAGEIRFSLRH